MKMLKKVSLLVLLSILVGTCSLDAGAFLYTAETVDEHDTAAAVYYVGVRYYDPHAGRFISRDPLRDGLNWYTYARNNPLAFIDPTGLRPLSVLEAAAVNSVFGGTVDHAELDIEIVEGLSLAVTGGEISVRGTHTDGTNKIKINAELYEAAGLNADSTLDNTDILSAHVISALGTVVHEAAHYWQQKFNRHTAASGYEFSEDELFNNRLGREQHASAAQVYFTLSWQLGHGAKTIDLSADYAATSIGPVNRYDAIRSIKHQDTRRTVSVNTARRLSYNFINFTQGLRDGRRFTTWANVRR